MKNLKAIWDTIWIQQQLRSIFATPENHYLGRKQQLKELARKIGCSLAGVSGVEDPPTKAFDEAEAERRIRETARAWREPALGFVAFASAIAAVFSAIAAWYAIMHGRP